MDLGCALWNVLSALSVTCSNKVAALSGLRWGTENSNHFKTGHLVIYGGYNNTRLRHTTNIWKMKKKVVGIFFRSGCAFRSLPVVFFFIFWVCRSYIPNSKVIKYISIKSWGIPCCQDRMHMHIHDCTIADCKQFYDYWLRLKSTKPLGVIFPNWGCISPWTKSTLYYVKLFRVWFKKLIIIFGRGGGGHWINSRIFLFRQNRVTEHVLVVSAMALFLYKMKRW